MKLLSIQGSPKRKGNTAAALDLFEERMRHHGHLTQRITVTDHSINGCLGCFQCQATPNMAGCAQPDDMMEIYPRLLGSDAVIYSTPLYVWDYSAQIKALIDRHFCLVKNYGTPEPKSLFQGKRLALLVSCAGGIENNADLIQASFQRLANLMQTDLVGTYVIPYCTTIESTRQNAQDVIKRMCNDFIGV